MNSKVMYGKEQIVNIHLKPTYRLTIVGLLVALNILLNIFLRLPTPSGFISLVEVGIFLAGWLFGPRIGGTVGGLTGLLVDLFAGYPQWMLGSLIIHGLEGYLIGACWQIAGNKQRSTWFGLVLSLIIGGSAMLAGYWLFGIGLQLLNHATLATALTTSTAELATNVLQVLAGFGIAIILRPVLIRYLKRLN